MKHNRRLFTGFVLLAALAVACSCPVSLPSLNPMKGIEETGMALVTQLPEGLAETALSLGSQVPEGLAATALAMATKVDVSPNELAKTAQAGIATFVPVSSGEPPADIPIAEGEVSMQMASEELVTYTINQEADFVKNFYQGQMLANGWTQKDSGGGFEIPGTSVLNFEKESKQAVVTIIGIGDTTQVMIEIKPK